MPTLLGPQSIGSTREYKVTLRLPRSSTGSLATLFDGDETFSLKLWVGDDQTPALSSTEAVEWIDHEADEPTLKITLTEDDVDGLTPGKYYLSLLINPGVDDVEVFEPGSAITLTNAAGSAVAGKTYASWDDLRNIASYIDRYMPDDTGIKSDYGEYRALARSHIDRVLVSRAAEESEDGVRKGGGWLGESTVTARRATVQADLDAGGLIVTPEIKEVASRLAAAMALEDNPNADEGKQGAMESLAAMNRLKASRLLYATRVTIEGTDGVEYTL